jgi:hypothetical protein
LARHIRYDGLEAVILNTLGHTAERTGHHREAVDYYRLTLARYRAVGGDYWATETLDRRGTPTVSSAGPSRHAPPGRKRPPCTGISTARHTLNASSASSTTSNVHTAEHHASSAGY